MSERTHVPKHHRTPAGVHAPGRPAKIMLHVFVFAAFQSMLYFAVWWFSPQHAKHWLLFIPLSIATFWLFYESFIYWFYLIGMKVPRHRPAPEGRSVDVFTTAAPGEPLEMFARSLPALKALRYPHRTWLLDGSGNPALAALAHELDIERIDCSGVGGAKAGKINHALTQTDGDIVLVIDPDHIAEADFLDRVLGQFDDETVGFVQVVQAYYNQSASFVARAAAEQSYGFYGPILMGMHGYGTPIVIGANCTFRRAALESIDGHAVHLVEDFVTSLRLHAKGWRSVYVPEITARGLVPEDLTSYFNQQLKWATGMFQVLFTILPRTLTKLRGLRKLSYLLSATYYFSGVPILLNLLLPIVFLFLALWAVEMPIRGYVTHLLPFAFCFLGIHLLAQRWMRHPSERGLQWRGALLKLATWPVYVLALGYAIARVDVPYLPTPKTRGDSTAPLLVLPHLVVIAASLAALIYGWYSPLRDFEGTQLMMFFAGLNTLLMLPVVFIAGTETLRRKGVLR
ncbi:MAG: glycosyltransferase [Bacteroidetes bacterium]|nr:glycosyltransferase [Bacteroidota bacterium]